MFSYPHFLQINYDLFVSFLNAYILNLTYCRTRQLWKLAHVIVLFCLLHEINTLPICCAWISNSFTLLCRVISFPSKPCKQMTVHDARGLSNYRQSTVHVSFGINLFHNISITDSCRNIRIRTHLSYFWIYYLIVYPPILLFILCTILFCAGSWGTGAYPLCSLPLIKLFFIHF